MERLTSRVPPLNFKLYKGQSGKVGIIGGCLEYTGAPYFAGASVLRCGGDLSHIFCARSAAIPIKSYAPEQIVHPYLPDENDSASVGGALEAVVRWLPGIQAFVIGPGLGRSEAALSFAAQFLDRIADQPHPVVIDGDALFLVAQRPELVRGRRRFVLTPNGGEFARLVAALDLPKDAKCENVAGALGGATVFTKGRVDVVSDGERTEEFASRASPRRVGGQGDVLAGALGLFLAWAPDDYFVACGAASELCRAAAAEAFAKKGRATITSDIVEEIVNVLPKSWSRTVE
jgi:ATP-dependent NAD(P)H-hydrate dehydratase